ncbi:MAG: OmpA family protein [Chitinophagaceae bacterium]|nr:OmpA family protein [Chitinophagaceae bacterium]
MKRILLITTGMILLSSCVAKRYLIQSQEHVSQLQTDSTLLQNKVYSLQNQIATMEKNIADQNKKIADLSSQNTQLGQKTAEQQNLLNQSMEDLAQQRQRLQQLESQIEQQKAAAEEKMAQLERVLSQQKAATESLKDKMTEALKGYNSTDLSVYQKNGKVYVSLSENLLFPSGSAVVNPAGVEALAKLAAVLNLNEEISVQIEGNTDSIPIRGRYQDNWELSTERANSVVRILVDKYGVNPVRVVSVGHSYFDPVDSNSTPEGRARNRRTDIVLSPNLDEMFRILNQQF